VDQGSLRDWIAASPSHGSLSLPEAGWWLWSVDKRDIADIFEELGRRRLIVCYGGRDTPSGGPLARSTVDWEERKSAGANSSKSPISWEFRGTKDGVLVVVLFFPAGLLGMVKGAREAT
jgi:hypothetical protein